MTLNKIGYTSTVFDYNSPGVYVRERPEEPTLPINLKDKSVIMGLLDMIDIEIIQDYVRAKKLEKIKGIK